MSWWEILLVGAIVLFSIGTAIWSIVRKKKGKGSCGCGCDSCPFHKDCENTKTN